MSSAYPSSPRIRPQWTAFDRAGGARQAGGRWLVKRHPSHGRPRSALVGVVHGLTITNPGMSSGCAPAPSLLEWSSTAH